MKAVVYQAPFSIAAENVPDPELQHPNDGIVKITSSCICGSDLHMFVERSWRTVKYEEVYLKAYANASEARREVSAYFRFYNDQRPHQALSYRTPAEVFHEVRNATGDRSKVTEGPPKRVFVSLA